MRIFVTAATTALRRKHRHLGVRTVVRPLAPRGRTETAVMPLARDRLEVLQVRKLVQCVHAGDKAQITKLVQHGISGLVNYQDPDTGEGALHVAAAKNDETLVMQLLDLGASLATQDIQGKTPLMTACEYGHLQALEALAARGVNLAVTDNAGKPAIFHCFHPTSRHAKCLGFLLDCGADPNTRDEKGLPVVCGACCEGMDKQLERLLEKGADPNSREPTEGKPALVLASEGGHVECVRLLMSHQSIDKNATYGEDGLCALHRAASLGQFLVIQALSAYGADFTVSTTHQENAVFFATRGHHLIVLRLLGQRGCPTNEENDQGLTPQKLAKQEGLKDAMKELKKLTTFQDKIARGARPKGAAEPWAVKLYDWTQVNKCRLLDLCREQQSGEGGVITTEAFASILHTMGSPLQSEDLSNLFSIYDKKREGVMNYDDFICEQKFIHAQYKIGPNDDLKAKKGKKGKKGGKKGKGKKGGKTKIICPIYYEEERPPTAGVPESVIEKEMYVTDMQRFSAEPDSPQHSYVDDSAWYMIHPERQYIQLYEAIRHSDLTSLQTALNSGMSVDMRDKYNKTPLMIACAHGRPDAAKFFLERGADVNAIDNFSWTPLHHCAHSGQEGLIRLLLDAGANIDAQSCNGGTPLMRAIETSQKSIVKLLLERGASVYKENKNGHSALDVAKNWGDDFIYAVVYAKAQTLPPVVKKDDKDKGGKGGKGGAKGAKGGKGGKGGKGKKKKGEEDSLPKILPGPPLLPLPPPPRLSTPAESLQLARQSTTLGSMHTLTLVKPSPAYRPRPAWVSRPSTSEDRLEFLEKMREETGNRDFDLNNSRTPFQMQIEARVQAMDIADM